MQTHTVDHIPLLFFILLFHHCPCSACGSAPCVSQGVGGPRGDKGDRGEAGERGRDGSQVISLCPQLYPLLFLYRVFLIIRHIIRLRIEFFIVVLCCVLKHYEIVIKVCFVISGNTRRTRENWSGREAGRCGRADGRQTQKRKLIPVMFLVVSNEFMKWP